MESGSQPSRDTRRKAAALKYDLHRDAAPRMTAKGKGWLADKILDIAHENNIPVREDPTLVHLLMQLDLGDYIPRELYQVVAEILSFIYRIERRARDGGL